MYQLDLSLDDLRGLNHWNLLRLIDCDALISHRRSAIGLNNRMVRPSVGIEDPEDIIADLENALKD